MAGTLIAIITSSEPIVRDRSLDQACEAMPLKELLNECAQLEQFRLRSPSLYERVRALLFLYAIHRFHIPARLVSGEPGLIPFEGYEHLLKRRFSEAISVFLKAQEERGPSDATSSALAAAYHALGFQTLADQVRRSVRSVRGNQWMFRMGHPSDHPLRIRPELLRRDSSGSFPLLHEQTAVRMDLSHSAWSDIFFLGMDFPEGARVLNVSIDLGVRGRDAAPRPPVETYLRVIDEPVLRLASVDLNAVAEISDLSEVFDFAKDYLGLLKAALIAAGIVPPGIEGSGQSLRDLLKRIAGPGLGLEIVTNVNNIPKGSRLAVSTNLLGSIIAVCMRATGQARSLTGPLSEEERRTVAARALLGEWVGGSGGGWQDSGGLWPGIKLITGEPARDGDPEAGVSRGRLLPKHHLLTAEEAPPRVREKLQDSLVLVHGGMAQNVGPILEMVTEKYLLRSAAEWQGRKQAVAILDRILDALRSADVHTIGAVTTENFFGPIQTIIPWATNYYTERLIARAKERFKDDFWGFWMLGGMAGGGMGFIFAPEKKAEAQNALQQSMLELKGELQFALPFAMEPVVYDFSINDQGTVCELLDSPGALLPAGYYTLIVPGLLRSDVRALSSMRRADLERFSAACRVRPELSGAVEVLFDRLFPGGHAEKQGGRTLIERLDELGFDRAQHEQIRADLKSGRIGLAQNRLPPSTAIEDVTRGDVLPWTALDPEDRAAGLRALEEGAVAVVTLAAGAGSRWTQGAGTVKALNPFCKIGGRHRTFIEAHLAKSRRISRMTGVSLPHVFTTGHLTHQPIQEFLAAHRQYEYEGPLLLSRGRAVGLRFIPMTRDLRFAWEEMPQQLLDEQKQKMRESGHAALMAWARDAGEGSDYTGNVPSQCIHPVGHWYEVPNMFRNGVLQQLIDVRPNLKYLLLHNIDTVGADADPAWLGRHIRSGAALSFEVISRRLDDRGGGLARVDGRLRLVEGLAMPRDDIEFKLSYYNTLTTWIDIDKLLVAFGLSRADLNDSDKVAAAIRRLAQRMPTYVTLKEVKKRWGHGQEDIFPVTQFEKLWGDMAALADLPASFFVVERGRGQQLKDPAQLDGWLRDGSAAYLEARADWTG